MSRQLLWDAAPGEMRAGLIEAGRLTELRMFRSVRKGPATPTAGENYTARVLRSLGPGKAQISLGGGIEAMLQPEPGTPEGSLIAVEIARAAIPEPGRWKLAQARPAPAVKPQAEPGRHPGEEGWSRFLRNLVPGIDAISCGNAQSVNAVRTALGPDCPAVHIDPQAVEDADFSGLCEAAVTGEFPLAGGLLSIERTRAMTVIDIDGSGDPLALNLAAAAEIGRLLRLYDIGGPVGIDFVTLNDRQARARVDAALAAGCEPLGPHKRTAMNGFGFVQIVRPRSGPSIPELLCGINPGRLSLASRALALLQQAIRSQGHGSRQLVAPPDVIDLIRQWPDEVAAVCQSLGTGIELVADPAASGYGHVHVSQS